MMRYMILRLPGIRVSMGRENLGLAQCIAALAILKATTKTVTEMNAIDSRQGGFPLIRHLVWIGGLKKTRPTRLYYLSRCRTAQLGSAPSASGSCVISPRISSLAKP